MIRSISQRIACAALALALLCSAGGAFAEEKYQLQQVAGGFASVVCVANTPYLLVQNSKTGPWGVINTSGKKLCPVSYQGLSYLKYNCFRTSALSLSEKGALLTARQNNQLGLIAVTGAVIAKPEYGFIQVYNPYWASCWVLEAGTEEDQDYKTDDLFFRIVRCDIYWLGGQCVLNGNTEDMPCLAASLTRDEFAKAVSHNDYLSVEDRQGQTTLYGPSGEVSAYKPAKANDAVYAMEHLAAVCRATGETITVGFNSVKEMQTPAGMLLLTTRSDFSGNNTYYLFDLQGTELMPGFQGQVVSITEDYALLKQNDLFGLYSLKEGRLLLPCEYESIVTNKKGLDPYVSFGYLIAVKDGAYHIISAETGETVRSFEPRKDWVLTGLLYYCQRKSSFNYFSPFSGKSDSFVGSLASSRGSGYLTAVKEEGKSYVMNWNGEKLTKKSKYGITITDDDHVIIQNDQKTYDLYKLVPEK